jgi:hypothetical protein
MKKTLIFIITLAVLSIPAINGIAQDTTAIIPTMINYQGFLTDQNGMALTGSYQITFALYYDSSSTASIVWDETHDAVNVEAGLFNVLLGSNDTLTADDLSGERYLGIRVAGEPEMIPRMRLVSVAYSLNSENANYADSANYAQNATYAKILSSSDGDPVDAVYVDDAGNVGIGTVNPTSRVEIEYAGSGNWSKMLKLVNTFHSGEYWELGVDADPNDSDLLFFHETTNVAAIDDDGTYQNNSDRRLKKDIELLPKIMDKVLLLKPSTYTWKKTKDQNGHKSIGFIAQDVDEVFSDYNIVNKEGDYWKLTYDTFGVLSIAAIQELKSEKDAEIKELTTMITKLKAEIDMLK